MRLLGHFEQYKPDPDPNEGLGVIYHKNAEGKDWYSFKDTEGLTFIVVKKDVVISVSSDITMLPSPDDAEVFVLDEGETIPEMGWTMENGAFVAPGPDPLLPLSSFQFQLVLDLLGITLEQVFALIDGLDWPDLEKKIAKFKVKTGGNDGRWSRENPLWDLLGPDLGITPEKINEEWRKVLAL